MPVEDGASPRIRAAQYLRMSTEHQRFSIGAQRIAIADYAEKRGYEVVKTYADPGKSGLSLKGRDSLRSLLSDALSPQRDFDAILILDVSRWGRFQDPDQAAHYEFICRQAGLRVVYCAEPFENDASPMATIFKHLKRVMAHEFSRELSDKLSRAHLHQAGLGLKQGGAMVYGFRRLLVDEHGRPKLYLKDGELKALRTDRVCFSLGSVREQKVIRSIFDLYVRREFTLKALARHLNSQGIAGNRGKRWTASMVRSVLTCELSIGIYTYNRTTQKLQSPVRPNPEHLWVRGPANVNPIVSIELFSAAQTRIAQRKPTRLDDHYMLNGLKRLWKAKGRLSTSIVNACPDIPSSCAYKIHFGSFNEALRRIDYVNPVCFSGRPEQIWTEANLRAGIRRLYTEHGYLSSAMVDADPRLPTIATIRKKIGNMSAVYDFAHLPPKTYAEIMNDAYARASQRNRGVPQPRQQQRTGDWTEESMISGLKGVLERNGHISVQLIKADPNLPSTTTLIKRFGSLIRAYNAAGWAVDFAHISKLKWARKRAITASQSMHGEE